MSTVKIGAIVLSASLGLCGCQKVADTPTSDASSTREGAAKFAVRPITLGIYTVDVPEEWKRWPDSEVEPLRKSVASNLRDIYQRYNQTRMPETPFAVAAFTAPDKEIQLVLMSMQLPPQEGLFAQLRNEAADKAKWGIQQGFITTASKTTALAKQDFDGFYLTMAHADKSLAGIAGLMHKQHQGRVINLQLTASAASKWTNGQLEKELLQIVESLKLK